MHLSMEMLKSQAGVDILHVPYKGAAPAVADLLGGHVYSMMADLPLLQPHVQAGRMRALAVTTIRRSTQLPNVPTIAESGAPKYEAVFWLGTFTAVGVPQPTMGKLNADLVKALQAPDVSQRLRESGMEVEPSTPEALGVFLKTEVPKWAKAVKDSGARPE